MSRPAIDLAGQRFGELIVIERARRVESAARDAAWRCRCDCGVEKVTAGKYLRGGLTRSCGHLRSKVVSEVQTIDLAGQRFGELIVVERAPRVEIVGRDAAWRCRCDCGAEKVISAKNLRAGRTRSCGHRARAGKAAAVDPALARRVETGRANA